MKKQQQGILTTHCFLTMTKAQLVSVLFHLVVTKALPLDAAFTTRKNEYLVPIFFDSSNHLHRCIRYHPEQPARIEACVKALQEYHQELSRVTNNNDDDIADTDANNGRQKSLFELIDVAPQEHLAADDSTGHHHHWPFSPEELEQARQILLQTHTPELVLNLEQRCHNARQCRIDQGINPLGFMGYIDDDTYLTTETFNVCLRATAAWIRAVDWVQQKATTDKACKIPAAVALTRPPGHHATSSLSNGFCIYNFAAAAALYYHNNYPNAKISILDIDVHCGNGVWDIVSQYPQFIRYASIHQVPAFPNMGTKREILHGNIFTIPMVPETTWTCGYQQHLEAALDFLFGNDGTTTNNNINNNEKQEAWEPDLVIVCAGYDALDSDDLASVSLNFKDYGTITEVLLERIRKQTKPTGLVLGLEGGYQLGAMAGGGNLQQAVVETVKALIHQ